MPVQNNDPNPEPASQDLIYQGSDLEAMAFAVNYHNWILEKFQPYLGKEVIEVGAGSGNFSEMLLQTGIEKLVSLEPSAEMYPLLESKFSD